MARIIDAFCIFFVCSSSLAHADDFLSRVSPDEVRQKLNIQLQSMLGKGDAGSIARLEQLQSQLKPLYLAMPRGADRGLDQAAARYALHRFFIQKYGWHVRGLELAGDEQWSDGASTTMLEDRIPGYVMQLFEQDREGQTGLPALAVLAATLEDVVHSEAIQLLTTSFDIQSRSLGEKLSGEDENRMVATYLLMHLMPNDKYVKLTTAGFNRILAQAPTFWTGWSDTVLWVQDLRDAMDFADSSRRNPFAGKAAKSREFNSLVRLVEGVGQHYVRYQDIECRGMKNTLLELSDGSGRVRLNKFYQAAYQNQSSHFSESPDYLRHLGALDETDPRQVSVILTNYMYARANCLASSSLYSICCLDECESLMGRLEEKIASPVADPQQVADLVAAMPSDTVAAPRNLSAPMRRRLDDIAGRHGGSIPLHGRLFAQWMHHAFPNECSFPHLMASLEAPRNPMDVIETENQTGFRLKASQEEMQSAVDAALSLNASDPLTAAQEPPLPWTEDEELRIGAPVVQPSGKASSCLRVVALAMAISSVAIALIRMILSTPTSALPANAGKARSWMPGSAQNLDQQWV